mgnify:CR=1 FL=1
MILPVILTLTLVITVIFLVQRPSLLHPSLVFASLWLLQLVGLWLMPHTFHQISLPILILVLFGVLAFFFGGLLASASPVFVIRKTRRFDWSNKVIFLLVIFCVGALVTQIQIVLSQDGQSLAEKLVRTRYLESIEYEDVFGPIKYASTLMLALMVFLANRWFSGRRVRGDGWLLSILVICCLTSAFFSTGRTPIIITLMVLSITSILSETGKVHKIRLYSQAILFVLIVGSIYWGVGLVLGKVGQDFDSALTGITTYFFSGLPALETYFSSYEYRYSDRGLGWNIFRIIPAVMSRFGLAEPPDPLVQDFVYVPHPTNLYTLYHLLIVDFGLVVAGLFPALLGFVHNVIYRAFMHDPTDDVLRFAFVFSFVPLIQTIFQDVYFSLVSTWVQLAFLSIILTKSTSRNSLVRKI